MPRGGKRPGAGRPKGSRNKRSEAVRKMLERLNCNPVEGLATIANTTESESLRVDCLKALLPYYAPKLATTDIKVASGPDAIRVAVEMVSANGGGDHS